LWFPGFAKVETPISVDVIRMHLYFDGFSDETIHVASFRGEEFSILEGHCSTGQSPQWAVVQMEEEEGRRYNFMFQTHKICFVLMTHDRDLHKIGATFYT